MNDRQRLEAIVDVVRSYLPPDGISREEAMSQIIGLVDPFPEQPEQEPFKPDWGSYLHGVADGAAQPEQKKEPTPSNVDPRVLLISDSDFTKETGNRLCDIERRLAAIETQPALAQPEQEPVAWYYADSDVEIHSVALSEDLDDDQKANCIPLYTAPPSKPWVSLTDEEINDVAEESEFGYTNLAQAIEAKLKEKNNG